MPFPLRVPSHKDRIESDIVTNTASNSGAIKANMAEITWGFIGLGNIGTTSEAETQLDTH